MSKWLPAIRCITEASKQVGRMGSERKCFTSLRIRSNRRRHDACVDNGQGRGAERSGDSANAGGNGGLPEVQRGARQGRRGTRGRPPLPELAEQASSV